jgi:hypothetical protein
MFSYRAITSAEVHIPYLPFSEVLKYTVVAKTICISVFDSLFACDDDNDWVLSRSYYSALLLPSKALVNVYSAIVNAACFKTPTHCICLYREYREPRPRLRNR